MQQDQEAQGNEPKANVSAAPNGGGRRGRGRVAFAITSTILLGCGALAAGVVFAAASAARTDGANRIAKGVRVAGVDVSEMTRDDAAGKVRAWARQQYLLPVTLVAPQSGRKWNIPLYEAGGRFETDAALDKAHQVGKDDGLLEHLWMANRSRNVDITPEFRFQNGPLEKRLAKIGQDVYVAPKNARAKMGEGGVLVVTKPERKGVKLDTAATKAALLKGGEDALRDGETARLVVREETPRVTSETLGAVGTLLASYSTSYGSSSASRRHNIDKAAGFIDGTLLGPGEVFSYNDTLGQRLRRLGWMDAPTYQDGQVVPGPGGGICQASTTLYNAVLRANLKIVERRNHSMPVHYVPPGCDATVDYGNIDFKFANSTDGPVYVMARATGGKLTFNLYGTESALPPGTVEVVSSGRRGTRTGGFAVSTWRVVRNADGTTTREDLGTSSYRPLGQARQAPPRRRIARRRSAPAATRPASPVPAVAPADASAV